MAPRDPRVTDLRRYRRDRERAKRAKPAPSRPNAKEPLLGGRKHAGLILVIVIAVLAAMSLMSGRHF
jgi:hypothetical protein